MTILAFITGGNVVDATVVPAQVINATKQIVVRLSKEAIALPWLAVYFGSALTGLSTPSGIMALAGTAFALGRSRVFSTTTAVNEKVYYVIPQSFGDPNFSVGGFSGGFTKTATGIDVNGDGVLYDVWESDQENLGPIEVVVT